MKKNKFALIYNNKENQNNNLNQKSDKSKKKKVRKFIRIKRIIKNNNNIKRIRKKKKIKTIPNNKNNQTPESPIFLSKENLNTILVGNASNSDSLNNEERFDHERSRIDLLRSNNDNNRIIIDENYDSERNTLYLSETIYIGLNSESLIHKKF